VSNTLQVFNFKKEPVRTFQNNEQSWFCLTDVCKILDLSQPSRVAERLNKDGVTTSKVIDSLGREQQANFINESNLYKVIFQSRKPEAEKFTEWITGEVLPTIRKTGQYQMLPKSYSEALRELASTVEEKEKLEEQNKLMAPKAEFFDAVAGSKDAIAIGDAAKVLNIGIGPYKLFQFLRDKKILKQDNIPYQEYIDRGYFRTIEQKYSTPKGETKINIKTLVYQKGLDYIRKLIEKSV
jgi:prophage antirepressor-like protein